MRALSRLLSLLALVALSACDAGTRVDPVVPVPPEPPPIVVVPPEPPPPAPVVDELARSKWDRVVVGMTEAEVVAVTGKPTKRVIVGPGYVALGFYVIFPAGAEHPGRRYVEATLGADGKVASTVVW